MTLSSLEPPPPAFERCELTSRCTTVSTSSTASTLPTTGVRMSARTNFVPPRSPVGTTVSMPMTREMPPASPISASRRAVTEARGFATPVTRTTRLMAYLPSRRRCTRVRLSILRCFFFDIRLRRFLMTEPTRHTFLSAIPTTLPPADRRRRSTPAYTQTCGRPRGNRKWSGRCSAGLEEGLAEELLDRIFGDSEGTTNAYGFEFSRVHQPVDRHLRDAHLGRHFCNSQERLSGCHVAPLSRWHARSLASPPEILRACLGQS